MLVTLTDVDNITLVKVLIVLVDKGDNSHIARWGLGGGLREALMHFQAQEKICLFNFQQAWTVLCTFRCISGDLQSASAQN